MPKLTFLGHACFLIEGKGGERLLFDPFISGNPLAPIGVGELSADYILVSHAHADHLGDAYEIAVRDDAQIISTAEIAEAARSEGCRAHALHIGGSHRFPFGTVKATLALHGSGIAGGHACGFLVEHGGKKLYFAGDTGLFGDMRLIGELHSPDLALLPIGDNFTMGIDDAVVAARFLQVRRVIPYHYNTWPIIEADPHLFKEKVEQQTEASCIVLQPGESCRL
ncbi:MAG TPA: metal-dependent hydrolase [Firmicutes bacterium]|jgi:L-ascorbate metabolism protein UlaG (beta-lactamase superfamily)|nr:metal-dependent hydrolase [Bacillota bacterium]